MSNVKRCPRCKADHTMSGLYCSTGCYQRAWYAKNTAKIKAARLSLGISPGGEILSKSEISEILDLIKQLREVVPGKLCGVARQAGVSRADLIRIMAGDKEPTRVVLLSLRMLQQKYIGVEL